MSSRASPARAFNDGTGVVLFMVPLGLATGSCVRLLPRRSPACLRFEVGGGILSRMAAGAGALWMLRQIDSCAVGIALTLRW